MAGAEQTAGAGTPAPKTPDRTLEAVCVGQRGRERGWAQPTLVFQILEPDGTLGREIGFVLKATLRRYRSGSVYALVDGGDGKVSLYTAPKYLRTWGSREERLEWWTASDAAETARSVEKAPEKAYVAALAPLEPLRALYRKTNSAGRIALEVRVLAYLRGAGAGGLR